MACPDREVNPGSQRQKVALVQWAFRGHRAQGTVGNKHLGLNSLIKFQLPVGNNEMEGGAGRDAHLQTM